MLDRKESSVRRALLPSVPRLVARRRPTSARVPFLSALLLIVAFGALTTAFEASPPHEPKRHTNSDFDCEKLPESKNVVDRRQNLWTGELPCFPNCGYYETPKPVPEEDHSNDQMAKDLGYYDIP